jgi:hypothetical protein
MVSCPREEILVEENKMRRTFAILVLFTIAAFWSGCGGSSDTSGNSGRNDIDTVNSERIDSSNIAPTGGPGPEPEGRGAQTSGNANETKATNKNKAESKNKNTQ